MTRVPQTMTIQMVGIQGDDTRAATEFDFTAGLVNHARADDGTFTRTSVRNFARIYIAAFAGGEVEDFRATCTDAFGTHEVPWQRKRAAGEFAELRGQR